VLQRIAQLPWLQMGSALGGVGHTVPQAPQLRASLVRSLQVPEHAVCPFSQVVWQTPAAQTCPVWQLVAQSPQCAASRWVLAQTSPHLV
jgi:hypothetical protein